MGKGVDPLLVVDFLSLVPRTVTSISRSSLYTVISDNQLNIYIELVRIRALAFGKRMKCNAPGCVTNLLRMLEMLRGKRNRREFTGALHLIPAKCVCPGF